MHENVIYVALMASSLYNTVKLNFYWKYFGKKCTNDLRTAIDLFVLNLNKFVFLVKTIHRVE